MLRTLLVFAAVAGCSVKDNGSRNDVDAGGISSDAPSGCDVFLTFDPMQPVAGDQVRATSTIDGFFGVPNYQWSVVRDADNSPVTFMDAQPDHSAISFTADMAGVYDVDLMVDGGIGLCPTAQPQLNVLAPGGDVVPYRLRVAAPGAPPQEQSLQVHGGAGDYAFGSFVLGPGVTATGTVKNGTAPVAAYLRFIPDGNPDEIVEAFAGIDGTFTAQLVDQAHTVLVVPAVAGSAPALLSWTTGQTTLAVTAGSAISGVVKDPAGAVLANATVQLTINNIPTTITTTAANGSFTVHGVLAPGQLALVDVTPPAASGLPRLTASAVFDLTQSVQVRYAAALVVRNLAGTVVQRGAGLANANVIVVGALAGAGNVTAGPSVSASGAVRASAKTNATGVLPALLAPNGPLSAVVEVTPNDLAVAAIDLSTSVPATITAPAQLQPTGVTVVGSTVISGALLAGAALEAAPLDALAAAGESSVFATSDTSGNFTLALASGGHYQLRLSSPTGLAGPNVLADVTGTTIPATILLPPPVAISGSVAITGNPAPIAGAAVQILCKSCVGIERSRPIASAASDLSGAFQITVADPGTM